MSAIKKLIFSRGIIEEDPDPGHPPIPSPGVITGYKYYFRNDVQSAYTCTPGGWSEGIGNIYIGINYRNWLYDDETVYIPVNTIRVYSASIGGGGTGNIPTGWYTLGTSLGPTPPNNMLRFWVDSSSYITAKQKCN